MGRSRLMLSSPPPVPARRPPGPHPAEQELLRLTNDSPVDLLCAPVPSCLPSPQLRPDPVVLQAADLIWFEEHPQEPSGRRLCVTVGWVLCGFSQTASTSRQDVNCLMQVGSDSTFSGTKYLRIIPDPFPVSFPAGLGSQPEVLARAR